MFHWTANAPGEYCCKIVIPDIHEKNSVVMKLHPTSQKKLHWKALAGRFIPFLTTNTIVDSRKGSKNVLIHGKGGDCRFDKFSLNLLAFSNLEAVHEHYYQSLHMNSNAESKSVARDNYHSKQHFSFEPLAGIRHGTLLLGSFMNTRKNLHRF